MMIQGNSVFVLNKIVTWAIKHQNRSFQVLCLRDLLGYSYLTNYFLCTSSSRTSLAFQSYRGESHYIYLRVGKLTLVRK